MRSRTPDVAPGGSAPVAPAPDARSRRITLVVNPSAGGGRGARTAAVAAARLTQRGVRVRTVSTRDAEHAAQEADVAFDRGDAAVAVGGDGMLRILAGRAVLRDDAVVGLLPAGRGNDFARFLGLPTDPVVATEALVDGIEAVFDTGLVRDATGAERTFLSIVSVGFDAEANRIANAAPGALGGLVYVWGAVGALAGLRPVPLRLTADGVERSTPVLLLAVANAGAYGGGMHMAPHASVGDGVLDVVLVPHRGRPDRCDWRDRLRILRFLPRVFRGTHVRAPHVEVSHARTLRVEADGPLVAYADGDPVGILPLEISTRPASLRMIVPATGGLRPGVDRPAGVAA
ncbi:diacylglycerol kinase family protein [Patulibacter sp. NPDC049589]|uniref:diacylglycerol/lipid kinase family protein n=1 Tax=Patulibacter sp. NPDC049589 TaxID=3154731 RepID=UPI0034430803